MIKCKILCDFLRNYLQLTNDRYNFVVSKQIITKKAKKGMITSIIISLFVPVVALISVVVVIIEK